MASTKALTVPAMATLNTEERAFAQDNLIKEGPQKGAYQGNGTRAQGLVWNYHKDNKTLLLHDQHDWSPKSISFYPLTLFPSKFGQPNTFRHMAPLPAGSNGAVVYADGKDSTARKWLVAFECVFNKVYVEAGPIGTTDWNVVKVKLDKSGSVSKYEDPVFHGKAEAEIYPQDNITLLYVYVEAGPIGPTDWENVEVRLDRSGPESSSVDPVYGGKAYAEIHQAVNGSIVYVWFSN